MPNNFDSKPNEKTPGTKGETIAELAHRHLVDENHITTEEEIRNAGIEFSKPPEQDDENLFEVDNTTVLPALPGEKAEDEEGDRGKGHAPNPYDLIG